MKQIENEWAEIESSLISIGAPDDVVRQYRGVFLTGMLAGLHVRLVTKADTKQAITYLTDQLGKLMLLEVGTDAARTH